MNTSTITPAAPPTAEEIALEKVELKRKLNAVCLEAKDYKQQIEAGDCHSDIRNQYQEIIRERNQIEADISDCNTDLEAIQRVAELREQKAAPVRQILCALLSGGYAENEVVRKAIELEAKLQKALP